MRDEAMTMPTAELWDAYTDELSVAEIPFQGFGRRRAFAGPAATVKTHEDHRALKALAAMPGAGRVLVVDGGGSLRVALMGDRIAADLSANGWAGAVVFGAIRDSDGIDALDIGVKALGTVPRRGESAIGSLAGIALAFAGLRVKPGDWIYADRDGIVAAGRDLALPRG
jgi:regulator of ribonuclease activity A